MSVLGEKGLQAQVCYEDLLQKLGENPSTPVIFNVNEGRQDQQHLFWL